MLGYACAWLRAALAVACGRGLTAPLSVAREGGGTKGVPARFRRLAARRTKGCLLRDREHGSIPFPTRFARALENEPVVGAKFLIHGPRQPRECRDGRSKSKIGRTGELTTTAMHRVDAWRMIQRRSAEIGMKVKIGCHTFRATGITAYLEAGGTLENAQLMAAHESPRTTKLYHRRRDRPR
jgi:integrase